MQSADIFKLSHQALYKARQEITDSYLQMNKKRGRYPERYRPLSYLKVKAYIKPAAASASLSLGILSAPTKAMGDLQGPMERPSSLRADLTPPGAVPRVKAIRRG